MSCGWKEGPGWGEEVSEKGSVKQTSMSVGPEGLKILGLAN